jgi:hypothetical protein
MEFDLTVIWTQVQSTLIGFANRLPAYLVALLVLALFFFLAGRISQWN